MCQILNIQPRTLQSYRDNGKLGFSQIEGKIFYRNEDVQKLLDENKFNTFNNKK
ncbi:helix-turn-helix domain-containing protein [Dysgonomonas sp. Marseille-P4677]|nr:helix-turn-helix domain-containing protein [Dysgonomonas sp. Marseille-P4677]